MRDYQNLVFSVDNGIGHIELNRPDKKNAINDKLCLEIEQVFINMPEEVRVIIFSGRGPEFCSGLDLTEHSAREPFEVVKHSNMWHRTFGHIQKSGLPVVAAMQGAIIGGGLELAACAHVRVIEDNSYFRLPEGRHGIFVGGGGSRNVARIIGAGRMTEMMLTGRTMDAEEGYRLGLAHYIVENGTSLAKARELAAIIATNSPQSNWAMTTGLLHIDSMSHEDGLYTESVITGMTQTSPEVQARLNSFLNRKKEQG